MSRPWVASTVAMRSALPRPSAQIDDTVAGAGELAEAAGEAGVVAEHGRPPSGHEGRRLGAVSRRQQGGEAGARAGEQPVKGEVEAGDGLRRDRPGCSLRPLTGRHPGGGERFRQRRLLLDQLGRPVAHPAGLDEHDAGVRVEEVGEEALFVGEPREPGLHAVEEGAFGDPLEDVTGDWCILGESGGALADFVAEHELTAAEDLGALDLGHGALVADVEDAEALDLVAPEVDPYAVVVGGGEDVDDAASHRQLAPVLHLVLAAVAGVHEAGDELLRVDLLAAVHDDRLGILHLRPELLQQGADRGHDQSGAGRRRPAGGGEGGV